MIATAEAMGKITQTEKKQTTADDRQAMSQRETTAKQSQEGKGGSKREDSDRELHSRVQREEEGKGKGNSTAR